VIQLYDLGTRLMYDLDVIVPMQDLIDKEKFDVSDIEPNIMGYYSVGGRAILDAVQHLEPDALL